MRCLPESCFLEAGLTSLTLPPDFTWIGPAACERCLQLQLVDLSRTEVTEIMSCAFAHCKHLRTLRLPNNLRMIQQEAFLKCASLTEVNVPPTQLYIARRAFAGCTQLHRFQRDGKSMTWRGTYSRTNALLRCDDLNMPKQPKRRESMGRRLFCSPQLGVHVETPLTAMPFCWHPCAGPV